MAVAPKEAEAIWRLPQKRRKLYGGCPKRGGSYMAVASKEAEVI